MSTSNKFIFFILWGIILKLIALILSLLLLFLKIPPTIPRISILFAFFMIGHLLTELNSPRLILQRMINKITSLLVDSNTISVDDSFEDYRYMYQYSSGYSTTNIYKKGVIIYSSRTGIVEKLEFDKVVKIIDELKPWIRVLKYREQQRIKNLNESI